MASNSKKTSLIRARKAKPNKKNRKSYLKRIQENTEALKTLASKE